MHFIKAIGFTVGYTWGSARGLVTPSAHNVEHVPLALVQTPVPIAMACVCSSDVGHAGCINHEVAQPDSARPPDPGRCQTWKPRLGRRRVLSTVLGTLSGDHHMLSICGQGGEPVVGTHGCPGERSRHRRQSRPCRQSRRRHPALAAPGRRSLTSSSGMAADSPPGHSTPSVQAWRRWLGGRPASAPGAGSATELNQSVPTRNLYHR